MTKRIYSKKQYQFLADAGALQSADDTFITAKKQEYRRMYLREWKRNKRKLNKEVTLYLTDRQYKDLADHAKVFGIKNINGYITEIILSELETGHAVVYNKQEIKTILQRVGMALMQIPKGSEPYELLLEAETSLLDYLHN